MKDIAQVLAEADDAQTHWTQMPPAFTGECPFHRGQSLWDCGCGEGMYPRLCAGDDACFNCDGDGTVAGKLCPTCKGKGER